MLNRLGAGAVLVLQVHTQVEVEVEVEVPVLVLVLVKATCGMQARALLRMGQPLLVRRVNQPAV